MREWFTFQSIYTFPAPLDINLIELAFGSITAALLRHYLLALYHKSAQGDQQKSKVDVFLKIVALIGRMTGLSHELISILSFDDELWIQRIGIPPDKTGPIESVN